MELQEIPHFLTKDTTSRRTCFALYTMSEKPLHLTAIRILAVWRTTLWCMNQKIKHFSKLKWEIPITLEWTLKEARLPILRNHYLKLKKSCTCYLFNYLFGKGKRGRKREGGWGGGGVQCKLMINGEGYVFNENIYKKNLCIVDGQWVYSTCKTRSCLASLFCASRSAVEGWFVNLCGWSIPPSFW